MFTFARKILNAKLFEKFHFCFSFIRCLLLFCSFFRNIPISPKLDGTTERKWIIALRPLAYNFIKKESLAQVFSCEFCKFLRTPFLQNTSKWLLLTDAFQRRLAYTHVCNFSKEGEIFRATSFRENVISVQCFACYWLMSPNHCTKKWSFPLRIDQILTKSKID